MHLFCRAQNCIDRAGLYAQRATDTGVFINKGDCFGFGRGSTFTERFELHAKQVRQLVDAFLAARRAAVDVRFAGCYRSGIGLAPGKAALAALRLRQNRVDLVYQRIAFHLEFERGKPQHCPQQQRKNRHHQQCGQHVGFVCCEADCIAII